MKAKQEKKLRLLRNIYSYYLGQSSLLQYPEKSRISNTPKNIRLKMEDGDYL